MALISVDLLVGKTENIMEETREKLSLCVVRTGIIDVPHSHCYTLCVLVPTREKKKRTESQCGVREWASGDKMLLFSCPILRTCTCTVTSIKFSCPVVTFTIRATDL